MQATMLRVSHLSGFNAFTAVVAAAVEGALGLLDGESEGFAIDATTYDSITDIAYVGGPVGGTVATIDTGTPANDLSNVALSVSNLVQSSTSPKMVHFPSSPYVRWSPHNLCTFSETITNANWTLEAGTTHTADAGVAPDGTTTAERITPATGNSNKQAYKDVGLAANVGGYTFSLYVKSDGGQWIGLGLIGGGADASSAGCFFDVINGAVGTATGCAGSIESVGSGWYRCSVFDTGAQYLVIEAHSADAQVKTWNSAASAEKFLVWGAQINRGPIATPYLVTTTATRRGITQGYDAAAAQYGILVEPAATNVQIYSEDFTQANYGLVASSIDDDSTTAPNGSSTADSLIDDTANDRHIIFDTTLTTSANNHTLSVYAKDGGQRYIQIGIHSNGTFSGIAAFFDLQTGTAGDTKSDIGAGTGTVVGSTITDVGNGWYRLTLTGVPRNASDALNTVVSNSDRNTNTGSFSFGSPSYTGTSGLNYIWGLQLELGSVATSYIPTLASTVTRAADNITAVATSFPLGSSHTAYISAKAREVATQHDTLMLDANNSNEDESVRLYTDTSANILMQIEDGGATQLAPLDSGVNASANTTFQITGAWATNDVDVSADGTAPTSDGTATMPTLTHMRLGNNPTPGNHLNGFIYKVVYVPRQVETDDGDVENWRYVA
jgi:hypothetical protein